MDGLRDRFLNVSLLPGSQAHLAYYAQVNSSLPGVARPAPARPAQQLHFFGGKTIAVPTSFAKPPARRRAAARWPAPWATGAAAQ